MAQDIPTTALKNFATSARLELIAEVGARLAAMLAPSSPERVENPRAVAALERAIEAAGGGDEGRKQVTDRVAYTWFNRIIALRFMDAHGYTGIGVVSPAADQIGQPEILAAAKRGQFDPDVVSTVTSEKVTALLNGTRQPRLGVEAQAEAYSLLLTAYCHFWNRTMPFMFQKEGDYTELLIPANLLAEDSVMNRAVNLLSPEVCAEVEVIGWLYQFYISERKDEVFAAFKKNKKAGAEEIPPATQLFTPHWIVQYLVENSVGRLWMLNHPDSMIMDGKKHYIAPIEEEQDFLEVDAPESLTVIDPAAGSGHMLTYAFDLLYDIYEEEGFAPAEIPTKILQNNLFGVEIDPRAGALAAFALTMKAAAKRKLFLKNPVQPNICVLEPIHFTEPELAYLRRPEGKAKVEDAFWNQFEHADTFGSLIQPDAELTATLGAHLETLGESGDLFQADLLSDDLLERAHRVITQAQYLSRTYCAVTANPPYMGSKQMNPLLSQFMKKNYPTSKSDLFAAFIERNLAFAGECGLTAMITMQSWMFLSSYEKLRLKLLATTHTTSMLHLGTNAFDTISGGVVSTTAFVLENVPLSRRHTLGELIGIYIRLVDGTSEADKQRMLAEALEYRHREHNYYLSKHDDAQAIAGVPTVYWLSKKMRESFDLGTPLSEVLRLRNGMTTGDNNRFLRFWWEVSSNTVCWECYSHEQAAKMTERWIPYNKGGSFRKWYGNQEYVVDWARDGESLKSFQPGSFIRSPDVHFLPSMSWSDVSSGEASFRYFPPGFIHDVKGMSAFGGKRVLQQTLRVMNSSFARILLSAVAPTLNFQVGDVGKAPISPSLLNCSQILDEMIAYARIDWDASENSADFACNPLIFGADIAEN